MKYVNNLLEYIGREDEIQHVEGEGNGVLALHHFPDAEREDLKVLVVFNNGHARYYCENGKVVDGSNHSRFILKPKPKKKVEGWRKAVLYDNGRINNNTHYYPTKEKFLNTWGHCNLIGEWQHIEFEVEED